MLVHSVADWAAAATLVWTALVGLLVAAKQLGFLEGKAQVHPHEDRPHRSNGSPTLGELTRTVQRIEGDYVCASELELRAEASRREDENLWAAIKRLEDADAATGRRIERLEVST